MLLTRTAMNERMVPDFRSATAAAVKIESSLPAVVREHCGELLKGVDVRWWPMSDVEHLHDVLPLMRRCIAEHRALRITYDSFHEGKRIDVRL